MRIIGISGRAHAGKDTVADMLVEKYGFIKIAFADSLKEMVQYHYGFKREDLWTDYKTKEVRRILQGTGEMIKSLEGDDFWIRQVQQRIVYRTMTTKEIPRVVISDVRFANEKRYVKEWSGITIRIDRPDTDVVEFNPEHVSEQELSGFDYIVDNRQGIAELEWKIDEVMKNEIISPVSK